MPVASTSALPPRSPGSNSNATDENTENNVQVIDSFVELDYFDVCGDETVPLIIRLFESTYQFTASFLDDAFRAGKFRDANVALADGKTPMHWLIERYLRSPNPATAKNVVDLLEVLISNGASPLKCDGDGDNVFMVALHFDCRPIVELLLEKAKLSRHSTWKKRLFEKTNNRKYSAMEMVVTRLLQKKDPTKLGIRIMKYYVEAGNDINARDDRQNTLLHRFFLIPQYTKTVGYGKPQYWEPNKLTDEQLAEVLDTFVALGADVNAVNDLQHTALHVAYRDSFDVDILAKIMPTDAMRLNVEFDSRGTILDQVIADRRFSFNFVQKLFDNGGEPKVPAKLLKRLKSDSRVVHPTLKNLVSSEGIAKSVVQLKTWIINGKMKELLCFLQTCQPRFVRHLKTEMPEIMLLVANVGHGNTLMLDIVKELLHKFNINVNYKNWKYGFVLHNLILSSDKQASATKAIKYLIKEYHSLDLNIKYITPFGEITALNLALMKGKYEIAKMLLEAGASVDDVSITRLANRGFSEVFKMLVAKGVDIAVKDIIRWDLEQYQDEANAFFYWKNANWPGAGPSGSAQTSTSLGHEMIVVD